MRFRARVAAVLLAAAGCGPSNTVDTPLNPVRELKEKPTSGPPPELLKK